MIALTETIEHIKTEYGIIVIKGRVTIECHPINDSHTMIETNILVGKTEVKVLRVISILKINIIMVEIRICFKKLFFQSRVYRLKNDVIGRPRGTLRCLL